MENINADNVFKKILFFTKVIMTLFVICTLIVLNFLDYKEVRANAAYLTVLNKVTHIKDDDIDIGKLEHSIAAWLLKQHPQVGKDYLASRISLATLLQESGMPAGEIRMSKSYHRIEKNNFQALNIEPIQLPETFDPDEHSVKQSILLFQRLAAPLSLQVLTNVDTGTFQFQKEQLFGLSAEDRPIPPSAAEISTTGIVVDEPPMPQERNSKVNIFMKYDFEKLTFSRDSVRLNFMERLRGEQRNPLVQQIKLRASHQVVTAPSLLFFAGFDSAIIDKMYSDSLNLQQISDLYGNQSADVAEDLINQSVESNTDTVAILGFDVSRKWFPLAVVVLLALLNSIIYQNTKLAGKKNMKIISRHNTDDALELLVSNSIIRFTLWVLSPIIILAALLLTSFIHYSEAYYTMLIVASVWAVLAGLFSFRLSARL